MNLLFFLFLITLSVIFVYCIYNCFKIDNFINQAIEIKKFNIIDDHNLKIVQKKLKNNQWVYNPSLIDINKTIYRVSHKTYCKKRKNKNSSNSNLPDQYIIYVNNSNVADIIYDGEDPRSILINDTIYLLYNKYKPNSKQYIYNTNNKKEYEIKYSENRDEKNWVPFTKNNNLYLIHTVNPLKILHINYNNGDIINVIKHKYNYNIKEDKLRGGSNLVKFNNYYLGVGHKTILPQRIYYHFFYLISDAYPFNLIKISKFFKFKFENYDEKHFNNIQFCCGLYLKNDKVVLSLGIGDCYSKLIELNLDYVLSLFK